MTKITVEGLNDKDLERATALEDKGWQCDLYDCDCCPFHLIDCGNFHIADIELLKDARKVIIREKAGGTK